MTKQETIDILREFNRWRRGNMQVGEQVRLRRDHQLHTITRIEEYDYRQPYMVDDNEWVGRDEIEWPDPYTVGRAIDNAITLLSV